MADKGPANDSNPASSTPSSTSRPETKATSTALPQSNAARTRTPARQASGSPLRSPRDPDASFSRRRSSLISYSSIDDLRSSFTDDLLHPRTGGDRKSRQDDEDQVTHWHSTPLAFAILPAIGGLLFQNGSAFITDILLLGFAAIFLNWSIRLPWDWYYSAQMLQQSNLASSAGPVGSDTPTARDSVILEEDEAEDDVAVDTASSVGGSPRPTSRRHKPVAAPTKTSADDGTAALLEHAEREVAAETLRRQELFALVATFVFPALAAYMLHVIRAQLSRPSTNLVSDYNLSIFLLAAEIRPCRQVIRLLSARTLHLQRVVSGTEAADTLLANDTASTLAARIAELEVRIAEQPPPAPAVSTPPTVPNLAAKADVSEASIELRRRFEPRLEGLERAVRRYEKRSTTLAITIDSRLQVLETRLQEALSLTAAVAEQSQRARAPLLQTGKDLVKAGGRAALAPPKALIWLVALPFRALDDLYIRFKNVMLGPLPASKAGVTAGPAANGKRRNGAALSGTGGTTAEKRKSPSSAGVGGRPPTVMAVGPN